MSFKLTKRKDHCGPIRPRESKGVVELSIKDHPSVKVSAVFSECGVSEAYLNTLLPQSYMFFLKETSSASHLITFALVDENIKANISTSFLPQNHFLIHVYEKEKTQKPLFSPVSSSVLYHNSQVNKNNYSYLVSNYSYLIHCFTPQDSNILISNHPHSAAISRAANNLSRHIYTTP